MPNYALRLTPYPQTIIKDDFVRERIPEFIEAIGGDNYLLGREIAGNIHYHIVFHSSDALTSKDIKDILYTTFEVPEDKIGNTTFSMEEVRDFDKACRYALKDGDIECSENWEEFMEIHYASSKKKPTSYKGLLADLYVRFENNEINERDLWIEMVQSRALFGDVPLGVNIRQIDEMFLAFKIRKDPQLAIQMWEDKEINRVLKNN